MSHATATRRLAVTALMLLFGTQAHAQGGAYRLVENWAGLPHGVIWGQVISVEVDAEGNVYAFHRCSADTCVERSEPPLLKFDPSGKLLMTWPQITPCGSPAQTRSARPSLVVRCLERVLSQESR